MAPDDGMVPGIGTGDRVEAETQGARWGHAGALCRVEELEQDNAALRTQLATVRAETFERCAVIAEHDYIAAKIRAAAKARHMTEHDRRILAPKNKPADDREALAEFARTHNWCQACGRSWDGWGIGFDAKTIHHIIGGRGGRSDEPANLLYFCWEPCHQLAEGLDIRGDSIFGHEGDVVHHRPLLPKITLGIALAMKIRAGELTVPPKECPECGKAVKYSWDFDEHGKQVAAWLCVGFGGSCGYKLLTPEWDRLTALHGRTLPDLAEIPQFFVDLYRRNRPELNT